MKQANQQISLAQTVKDIARVSYREATGKDPDHFFRVRMENVRKFHSDNLLNIKLIRKYLSQVAPVPYDSTNFSFAGRLDEYFANISGYRSYRVRLNGERILRPYSNRIEISSKVADEINDIECFEFSANDRTTPLALGWYAKINFRASLPTHVAMKVSA